MTNYNYCEISQLGMHIFLISYLFFQYILACGLPQPYHINKVFFKFSFIGNRFFI